MTAAATLILGLLAGFVVGWALSQPEASRKRTLTAQQLMDATPPPPPVKWHRSRPCCRACCDCKRKEGA